jgi:hypothetical protein
MNRDEIIKLAQEIAAQYSKAERFQTWTHDFMMQRLMELVSVSAAAERERWVPDVDELAQHIRWLNGGNKKMGAGALAEKLVDWLRSRV